MAKEKKVFAATWSFYKSVEISSAVERMLLPGGYLKKIGGTYNPDTLIIHDIACVLIFSSRPPFIGLNVKLILILPARVHCLCLCPRD